MTIPIAMHKLSMAATGAILMALGTVTWIKPVSAAAFIGTPSCQNVLTICSVFVPNPEPSFGTLINFDEQPTDPVNGTQVTLNPNTYASLGVASIAQLDSSNSLLSLEVYPYSDQSIYNYVGTATFSSDESILIEFANLINQVGVGVISGLDGVDEVVNIYDSSFNLLDTLTLADALNSYVFFEIPLIEIKYLEITGTQFAIDDLQFGIATIPEPNSVLGLLAFGALGGGFLRKRKLKS